jgi:hypothetical protein
MSLADELKKNKQILIIYSKDSPVIKVSKDAINYSNKLGLISLQSPVSKLIPLLGKQISEKTYFVDGYSVSQGTPRLQERCIYLSSPSAFAELKVSFSSIISEKNRNTIVFDNLNILEKYYDATAITKLINNLSTRAREFNAAVIFLASRDLSDNLIEDIKMICDKCIENF